MIIRIDDQHQIDCSSSSLLLFDGVCNFCNFWVNFIIRHDKHGKFRFLSLQSEKAQSLADYFARDTSHMETIVLIEEGRWYTHSTAVLRICKRLDGVWKLLFLFIIVPKPIRDAVYRWVAKHRYRIWGVRESCMIPTKEIRDRFL